ncbi:MAG: hypothetical protein Q9220_000268 [cf. Caloplaca sp. 1 TL-2023]
MRHGAVNVILLLCILLVRPLGAIYADEAYEVDFHHALLGSPNPRTTFFHRLSTASKASLLYTLSDRSVLGAVNPKNGAIVWRQQLNSSSGLLIASSGENAIYSAVGEAVQAWDAPEGRLLWEWRGPGNIIALEFARSDAGKHGVYILSRTDTGKAIVRKLSADSGVVIWEHQDDSGDIPHGLWTQRDRVYYVALHSALLQGSKIKVSAISAAHGNSLNSVTLNADKDLADRNSIIPVQSKDSLPLLIWSDRSRNSLRVNILGSSRIHSVSLSGNKDGATTKLQIHASSQVEGVVDMLVHCQSATTHWAEVYQLNIQSETLTKAYPLPAHQGPATFSAAAHGGTTYFVRTTEHDVTLFSAASNANLGQWTMSSISHDRLVKSQGISGVFSEVVSRGSSNYAVRSAVLLASGDWNLIYNGEESWFRPESLSGAIAAAWAETEGHEDLADELAVESHSNVVAAYIHRLKRHAKDAQKIPSWAQGLPDRILDNLVGQRQRPRRQGSLTDGFGFRKTVIVATDSGRLFALEASDNGKIIWSIQAHTTESEQHWTIESIVVHHGIATIHTLGQGSLKVNVKNGVIIERQEAHTDHLMRSSVSLVDPSGSPVPIRVKAAGSIDIPKLNLPKRPTIVVTQDEKMIVRGWSLISSGPFLAWKFMPQPNEKIVSVTARPPEEPVASIGKALGDRNVLYKFLNPNLLVIATMTEETSLASFYVLDSVSGLVVHSLKHPHVDPEQRITCVVSENWIAYSLFSDLGKQAGESSDTFSTSAQGYQLVVSELFESSLPNDRGMLGSTSNTTSMRPFPVGSGEPSGGPYVITQTYLVSAAISFMAVTTTLQGITPRSLLCVVPSLNSVVAIPRILIDPRRPIGRDATPSEAEEGLFRHDATLDFDAKWALNHMREVFGLQTVITTPSLLESTSLVFAYGSLDMFGTRIAPIGAFDILGKGFNKIQLVGTVAALAVGTGLLAPMVRKKQTDTQWQST